MIVCGDDALVTRLAGELHEVYRERVTLVVPSTRGTGRGGRRAAGGAARAAVRGDGPVRRRTRAARHGAGGRGTDR
ncbi:hypothetical protein DEH69_04305 [Streptomyces sp. PT12]|nr:hypothetical protein DEH69_04305 [Streptomyces sp. PT12]